MCTHSDAPTHPRPHSGRQGAGNFFLFGASTRRRVVGGCTRSSVLMQILADVVGCPVQVTHSAHVGALGASVIAGVGLRWFADLEVLQLPEVAVFRPRLPNHAQYSRLYAIHQQLYPALRTAFHALADFT
eukprot:EG_transcript_23836